MLQYDLKSESTPHLNYQRGQGRPVLDKIPGISTGRVGFAMSPGSISGTCLRVMRIQGVEDKLNSIEFAETGSIGVKTWLVSLVDLAAPAFLSVSF